jgi:hypothetical protein
MGRLVAVLPLKPGARDRAEALLRERPPFDLELTRFDRHQVFLTNREVVFVFEGEGQVRRSTCPPRTPRSGKRPRAGRLASASDRVWR